MRNSSKSGLLKTAALSAGMALTGLLPGQTKAQAGDAYIFDQRASVIINNFNTGSVDQRTFRQRGIPSPGEYISVEFNKTQTISGAYDGLNTPGIEILADYVVRNNSSRPVEAKLITVFELWDGVNKQWTPVYGNDGILEATDTHQVGQAVKVTLQPGALNYGTTLFMPYEQLGELEPANSDQYTTARRGTTININVPLRAINFLQVNGVALPATSSAPCRCLATINTQTGQSVSPRSKTINYQGPFTVTQPVGNERTTIRTGVNPFLVPGRPGSTPRNPIHIPSKRRTVDQRKVIRPRR